MKKLCFCEGPWNWEDETHPIGSKIRLCTCIKYAGWQNYQLFHTFHHLFKLFIRTPTFIEAELLAELCSGISNCSGFGWPTKSFERKNFKLFSKEDDDAHAKVMLRIHECMYGLGARRRQSTCVHLERLPANWTLFANCCDFLTTKVATTKYWHAAYEKELHCEIRRDLYECSQTVARGGGGGDANKVIVECTTMVSTYVC